MLENIHDLRNEVTFLSKKNNTLRARIAELETQLAAANKDAERWRECERLAESQNHSREKLWTIRFVSGATFEAAIDARIASRKERGV